MKSNIVSLAVLDWFYRAANNFSFLKGHMSDHVSILVGQNRNAVGRLSLFTYYLVKKKSLFGRNVRPKLTYRRTWADDRQLFYSCVLLGHITDSLLPQVLIKISDI